MRPGDEHTSDQYAWHMRVIRDILAAFQDGAMTAQDKRRAITAENTRYYQDGPQPDVTRPERPARRKP